MTPETGQLISGESLGVLMKRIAPARFSWYNTFMTTHAETHPTFLSLVNQHLRSVSRLYIWGIVAFASWTLPLLLICLLHNWEIFDKNLGTIGGVALFILFIMMVIFWGNIFAGDWRNNSYQSLHQAGIPVGKIWWSRMLPAMLFYLPVLVSFACWCFLFAAPGELTPELRRSFFVEVLPLFFTIWLLPVAVGSFVSISIRNRRAAIALTIFGFCPLFLWMYFFFLFFGCHPTWSTLPICIALLIASRMRATYWLREIHSWRGRFVPLVPVFVAILVVFVAMPFVRVYSVPYVSWEQIETFLDQADIPERMSPDKRKELIQFIANNNALPPGYDTFFAELDQSGRDRYSHDFAYIANYTYEEYLLLYFAHSRYVATNPSLFADRDMCCPPPEFIGRLRYLPWELARADRRLRFQILKSLVESGSLQDERAKSLAERGRRLPGTGLDRDLRDFLRMDFTPEGALVRARMQQVANAVGNWYRQHGTLPESLDVLVDTLGTIPVHPFTGKIVEYHRDSPSPIDRSFYMYRSGHYLSDRPLGNVPDERLNPSGMEEVREMWRQQNLAREAFIDSGGTYIRLGKSVIFFIEFP